MKRRLNLHAPNVLHAVGADAGSAEYRRLLDFVVGLELVCAKTATALAAEAILEAVVLAGPAKGRRSADRRVPTFDALRLAGAVAETFEDELVGKDAILAVSARWTVGNASAAVWKSARRRAFIVGARVGGLAAHTFDADLVRGATAATALAAVRARRTNTAVLDADLSP
jgi:hypothetical protein